MNNFTFDELVNQKIIHLRGKGLHDEDLEVIIKVLRDKDAAVKKLYLSGNNITLGDGKFTDALSNNKTIEELSLSHNNIGAEGAKCLAAALSNNNTLKGLDLDNNNIGVEGVKCLAEALKVNTTLEEIYLGGKNIGDEGTKHLARALMVNRILQQIGLESNSISDEGAKSIAMALLLNQGIRHMHLEGNEIGGQGADKLVGALQHNNSIRDLGLGGNQISNSVLKKIDSIVKDTNRKRKKLTSQQLREIIAMKDEELANNVKAMVKQDTIIAMKDEEIADKDKAIVQQGDKLKASEEEKKRLKQEIFRKDREIASLKAAVRGPLKQLKKLELIVNAVDMTSDEAEPNSKRPRTENAPKSMHAIIHEQNQKLVQVKQEKIAAEGEKEAVERKMELALECTICYIVKDETCALVPCGHIMCSGCAGNYTACPTCSRNVESRCRLYK